MSMLEKETVKCPKCGADVETKHWSSINTEMPFAIDDIISGKLFKFKCSSCGITVKLDYPILFNDMKHNVMIHYCSPENAEGILKMMDSMPVFVKRSRVVRSQMGLREKTMIFNDELDDRTIEFMKAFIMNQLMQDGKEPEEAYYVSPDVLMPEACFEFCMKAGDPIHILFDKELYETLDAAVKKAFAGEKDNGIIDCEWALENLEKVAEFLE